MGTFGASRIRAGSARVHFVDRELEKYVVQGREVVHVKVRKHWMSEIKTTATMFGLLGVALFVDITAPPTPGGAVLAQLAWGAWLISLVWFSWRWLNWRRDWFVATDKRFLMFYGFITRRVAMMPLVKVTDLTYNMSILGRIFHYGDFTLESAGQHQALNSIDFIPDADRHYRIIMDILFGDDEDEEYAQAPDANDWDLDEGGWWDAGDGGEDGGHGGRGPDGGGRGWGPAGSDRGARGPEGGRTAYGSQWSEPEDADSPRAFGIPIPPRRRPRRDRDYDDRSASPPAQSEIVYRSADLVAAARLGDTGELPVIEARPLPVRRQTPWRTGTSRAPRRRS